MFNITDRTICILNLIFITYTDVLKIHKIKIHCATGVATLGTGGETVNF